MAEQDSLPTLSFAITVDGQEAGTQEFEQEMVTIGKGGAAVLQITDEGLADLHAAVQVADDGSVTLLDLGSETGTLLNGESVNNSAVNDGDEIQIGKTHLKLGIAFPELEEDTDEGPAPIDTQEQAEIAQVEDAEDVMDFILRSGTAQSDLGIDRNAPKVLEIAELWSGTVLNVKHFDKSTPAVYVGDRRAQVIRVASGLLTAILVFGSAFFMIQQVTIPEPPRMPQSDIDLVQDWQKKAADKAATVAAERAAEVKKENEELAAAADSRIAQNQKRFDQGIKVAYAQAKKAFNEKQAEARARHDKKRAEGSTTKSFKSEPFCRSVLSDEQEAEVDDKSSPILQDQLCKKHARQTFIDKARNAEVEKIREARATAEEARLAKLEPPNPLRDYKDAWTVNTKQDFKAALARFESNRGPQPVPPFFDLFEKPDYEDFIRNQMLPIARQMAAKGELRQNWIEQLLEFEREYVIYDDLQEKRVVEDVVLATRIRRENSDETLMLIAGNDPSKVYAKSRANVIQVIPVSEPVYLWGPSEQEVAARAQLFKDIQTTLYANARVKNRLRAMCRATEELITFDENKDNFEFNALYSECLFNQGKIDQAREHYAKAIASAAGLDMDKDDAAGFYLRALRVRARVLLKDAHQSGTERNDYSLMDKSKREAAMVAHDALHDFLIESGTRDSASLRAVDKGIFLLEREKKREQERELVRNAIMLSFFIFLVLPIGFGFDEIRSRKMAQDFFVDSENLPSDHFPIVEQDGDQVLINFTEDSVGFVESSGGRTSTADLVSSGRAQPKQVDGQRGGYHQVELGDDERFVNDIGHVVFFIHRVHKAKVIPAPFGKDTDWLFLVILSALLFLGGALAINLMLTPYDPSQEVITIPDRFVELMIQEVEKEKKEKKPSGNEDAGEGAKAKEEEGKTGKKEHKLKKAKGSKVAIDKSQLDKQIAESTGLLADLNQLTDSSMFGTGGLDNSVSSAVGGLIGSQYGQFGAGGLGSRGSGLGGGGSAAGLGGLGTRGTGAGASGYGRGGGHYGKKGGGAPGVGTGNAIILGALDKSIIDRIVKQHLAKIRYCYQKELNKNPKLFGKIIVKFVIAKDGSVSTASTKSSTMRNPIVEKCINSRFMRMRFPAPKGGGIVIVSYPFMFNAQGN